MSKQSGLSDNPGFNNISVTTINAETLTLRQGFQGTFIVSGGDLEVKQNAIFDGTIRANAITVSNQITTDRLVSNNLIFANQDVDISGNVHIYNGDLNADHNVHVLGNIHLYGNLVLGNNTTYIYTTPSGDIGINKRNATATLDISGTSSNTINVYSSQPTNFNVIARNVDNHGISVSSNATASSIGFYNNRDINETISDATISYSSDGAMTIDVSRNTNILSSVSISNTSIANPKVDHLFNETVVVYDISSTTPYLYDTYRNANKKTGAAMSLVSNDASSNTFLNIVSTNKKGLGIGGGGVYENNRTMGTIGLYNTPGKYTPSINVVSGNSNTQYKTVVGVNTHAPLADNYVLDVNGPLHISNGEVSVMESASFEILKMSISRTHPNYGVAVGTPITIAARPYKQRLLYTNDGGNTWNTSIGLDGDTIEAELNFIRDVYVVNDRLAVLVGDNGNAQFTLNGGKDWDPIVINIQQDNNFKSVYVSNTNRIFISTANIVYWFDTQNIYDILPNTGFVYDTYTNGTFSILFATIQQIMGHNNSLFVICNNDSDGFIQKYSNINTTPTRDITYTNPGFHYKQISTYNDNYVSAITGNTISYTTNGGVNWSNVSVNYDLNSIYVYDTNISIAVGKKGVIAYTSNGNLTWDIAPFDILNSSGNANTLVDPSFDLTNVVFRDINNIIITQHITSYGQPTYGKSDIFHIFCPAFLNNANNYVMDISGSVRVSGDVCINDKGKIVSTNRDFYLLNQTVKHIFMGGDASAVYLGNSTDSKIIANRDMVVQNDASFNRDVSVDGNTQLRKHMYLYGDASLNANLFIARDTSMNGILRVDGNVYLHNRLFTLGDASFGSNVIVIQDVSLNRDLRVDGNVYLNNRMFVLGDASFGGNVLIRDLLLLSSNLQVEGNTLLNKRLFAVGDASFGGNLTVLQDISLNQHLRIDGNIYANNRVFISNDASFGSNLTVIQDISLNRDLRVDGNVFLNNRLFVTNDASFSANIQIYGDASFNGNVSIFGNIYLNGNIMVNSDKIVYSRFYEGAIDSSDIYIGTRGLNQDPLQPRTIYIGNNGTTQNSKNIIKIGGGDDSVVIGGQGVSIEKINAGRYISFNDVDGGFGQYQKSGGAGLRFVDNSANPIAGLFVVSDDTNGYVFKAPGNTNVVKLDVAAITIPINGNIKTGLLTVTSSTDQANSHFTIGAGEVDISNILIKKYSNTDASRNIQIIDTSLGILGNAYVLKNFAVGKTTTRGNTAVDMIGNVFIDKLNISTDGSLNSYKLEISGNVYQHSGFIWQF